MRTKITCSACGELVPGGGRFCPWCGAGMGAACYPLVAEDRIRAPLLMRALVAKRWQDARRARPRWLWGRAAEFNVRANTRREARGEGIFGGPGAVHPPAHCAATNDDPRSHQRHSARARVSFSGQHSGTGKMENLSRGGLFVATRTRARVHQQLQIRFLIPGQRRRHFAVCEVRWLRPTVPDRQTPGMGLRFIDLDPHTSAALEAFVQQQRADGRT